MTVRVERDGPVTTVILDRPQVRNAVDGPTAAALADAFAAFDADETASVAVLWGAGGTFCAGADLHAMSNPLNPDVTETGPMGPSRMALSKPVIAAISGHAVAGGLELALWCDLRVAESDAVLGVFCRRWGVPLIDGGTVRLPRIVGLGRALDLILTGRAVASDEALAHQLAALPQACLRSDRRSVYDALGSDEPAALASEFAHGQGVLGDALRGAARFSAGAGRHGAPAD
ncbi:MAG TPA: crotonase/enoyl-CoA hydratase family protein [Jatrophihabitantaceae bacterium]|nr:crotonase/enoyl-CoA hydratase family protein [Jatrophihabitantaceae bacterium]